MLNVEDVHTYYGKSYILQGIFLSVDERQVASVVGRNGVGKTTLIRSIMGLIPVRKGKITFQGRDIIAEETHRLAKMGIGLVPQGRHIFPSLSVKENLDINARKSHDAMASYWDKDKVIELFPVLKNRLFLEGARLSGGEQQMLAIARALMGNPKLLLMDEPSEGLAPVILRELGKRITQLKKEGLSILLVEQNLQLALRHCDYLYIISKGKIVYSSIPDDLWSNEEVRTEYLGI